MTAGRDVCLVDLSPINLHPFAQLGFRTVAGDATDEEILRLAGADTASLIFVCVPSDDAAILAVKALRQLNRHCFLLVRCRYEGSAKPLREAGADSIVSEETQASEAILAIFNGIEEAEAVSRRRIAKEFAEEQEDDA